MLVERDTNESLEAFDAEVKLMQSWKTKPYTDIFMTLFQCILGDERYTNCGLRYQPATHFLMQFEGNIL